jgi:hypothetical protein
VKGRVVIRERADVEIDEIAAYIAATAEPFTPGAAVLVDQRV